MSAAVLDGFIELPGCGSTPQGTEAIGFVNLARAIDQSVAIDEPESLLYVPESLGGPQRIGAVGRRLVALEYSVPVTQDGQEQPELFGRRFSPVAGRIGGLQQFRLRVWLFSANPDGMFADANPAEACTGSELVAPHAYDEGRHEVLGQFSIRAARVRKVLGIPPEFRLRGEAEDGSGDAEVWFLGGAWNWSATREGATEPTKLAAAVVGLQPPDWTGGEKELDALYPFSWLSDNRRLVRWMREGMGVGPDVIDHSPNLALDFEPTVSRTGSGYRFSSPDFVLDATVTDAVIDVTSSPRFWHESPRGMGLLREWFDEVSFFLAGVTVAPRPGTVAAKLLGCDPGPDPGLCQPVSARFGTVLTSEARVRLTAGVSQDWWNPRGN